MGFILDTARRIICEGGIEALTTRHVAARSGVAIGSLYQYFPNREAIFARLAEEEARRESRALQCYYASMSQLPLVESLQRMYAWVVESERRMLAFGGTFYQRFAREFRAVDRAGSRQSEDVLGAETLIHDTARWLEGHDAEIGEPDVELVAYLLARGIPEMLGKLIAERPELLDSERIEAVFGRIAAAVADIRSTAKAPNSRKRKANSYRRTFRKQSIAR